VVNEYQDRFIPCNADAAISIGPVGECPLPGDDVINSLGIVGVTESYWFNIFILIVLQLLFRVAAYVLLRRSK
jgi:hypothetical protein